MRDHSLGREIGNHGRFNGLQQLLTVQRFHFAPTKLEQINLITSGAIFDDDALAHIFRAASPNIDLHAKFFLKGIGEDFEILNLQ